MIENIVDENKIKVRLHVIEKDGKKKIAFNPLEDMEFPTTYDPKREFPSKEEEERKKEYYGPTEHRFPSYDDGEKITADTKAHPPIPSGLEAGLKKMNRFKNVLYS